MQLLPLIFLASAHILTSNAECIIQPITPTNINGFAPCSYGSLAAGCFCCPDDQTTCQSLIQVCSLGTGISYVCENNPQYLPGPSSSPTVTMSTLGTSTTENTETSSTSTSLQSFSGLSGSSPAAVSTLKPPITGNTATSSTSPTSSTSTSHSQSSSIFATRKGYGRTSKLVAIVVMIVFIFSQI